MKSALALRAAPAARACQAVNIMSIYGALADEEKNERTIQFCPVRCSRYS